MVPFHFSFDSSRRTKRVRDKFKIGRVFRCSIVNYRETLVISSSFGMMVGWRSRADGVTFLVEGV